MSGIREAIKNCGSSTASISNQGIINLRMELEKGPNAASLITTWFGESDLSFAVSKVINETHKIFTNPKGMDLKDNFHTYAKITALLMVYDYCKDHAKEILDHNFDAIVLRSLDSKTSDAFVQANKAKIEEFIPKLLSNSTYNTDIQEYTIYLKDYTISDDLFLKPEKGADASFVVKISDHTVYLPTTGHRSTDKHQVTPTLLTTTADKDDEDGTTSHEISIQAPLTVEEIAKILEPTTLGDTPDA